MSYGKELPLTRSQYALLVGAGTGSNPIRWNFYGIPFEAEF